MPRNNYRQIRFTDQELSAYKALAKRANLPLATWVRETLNYHVRLLQATAHVARELYSGESED